MPSKLLPEMSIAAGYQPLPRRLGFEKTDVTPRRDGKEEQVAATAAAAAAALPWISLALTRFDRMHPLENI